MKEDAIQDMMEVVLESGRDDDGHFSDVELKRLLLRLKNLPAIEVNQGKFMERAQMHRSISDVFAVMKTIYSPRTSEFLRFPERPRTSSKTLSPTRFRTLDKEGEQYVDNVIVTLLGTARVCRILPAFHRKGKAGEGPNPNLSSWFWLLRPSSAIVGTDGEDYCQYKAI